MGPTPSRDGDCGDELRTVEDAEFSQAIAEEENAIAAKQSNLDDHDTEADTDAEPVGSGPKGRGPPMRAGTFERERPLCDGAGLCSLGQWCPADRPPPTDKRLLALRAMINGELRDLKGKIGMSAPQLFDALAKGAIPEDPFPELYRRELHQRALAIFDGSEFDGRRHRDDRPIALHLRLLEAVLHAGRDPDRRGLDQYGRGVRLGIGVRLPRMPAVFGPKRQWRLAEQRHADDLEGVPVEAVWMDNYKSVVVHRSLVEAQLDDHYERGLALRLTRAEAAIQFPDLTVAAMGAVSKVASPSHFSDIRLVIDGSNGVHLNTRVKQLDQDRCPTAADVKRVQRAQSAELHLPLGLALDVQEAHRIPPTREEDWRHQGVRSHADGYIDVYK